MGMFLSKYSMLNALGYGADRPILEETKKILDRFKLFGLILHDPNTHSEFHSTLRHSFERLDFLTGRDFLFFALTDPPRNWIERNERRDYFGIWETDKLLSPMNSYKTNDESISTYSIAQALNIDFDDLPVIILTNNFQFNQFRVVKTCSRHLESQMTEIGYFSSQKEKYFSLITDADFNKMIKGIDKCGGSYQISNEESLAKTLSDFLAFVVSENRDSLDRKIAEIQIGNVITKFLENKDLQRDPTRYEQLNLFLLGCLSNLSRPNRNQEITIDERCESESKIILKTFNKVFPFFEPLNNELQHFQHIANREKRMLHNRFENDEIIDYSPLIISLCKIFEIETNLSLVHWFRKTLNIEMPTYFKKHKEDNREYKITPSESVIHNPRPIDFNKGYGTKWIAPGIGESELVTQTFLKEGNLPAEISDYDELLRIWAILRQYRNKAAHTENLRKQDFEKVYNAFSNIITSNYLKQFNDLKWTLKQ
jgi:quinol monooxygenase YgiN